MSVQRFGSFVVDPNRVVMINQSDKGGATVLFEVPQVATVQGGQSVNSTLIQSTVINEESAKALLDFIGTPPMSTPDPVAAAAA